MECYRHIRFLTLDGFLQENAEMLTQEGKLLQKVQTRMASKSNSNENSKDAEVDEELDNYAVTLAEFLDRKQLLISKLQSKLIDFKLQLAKEQELAQRFVEGLSQQGLVVDMFPVNDFQ